MDKEIKKYIISIIKEITFLIIITIVWLGKRDNLATDIFANIGNNFKGNTISVASKGELTFNKETSITIKNKMNVSQNYEIIVSSNYQKMRTENCNALPNNYLRYKLNNYEEKNLSIDGIIYTGVLNPNEEKDFSINIFLDNNMYNSECYYPVIKVSAYKI